MRPKFIQTKNAQAFMDGMDKLGERGASEACFMVVDGKAGLGKTRTLYNWATKNDCVFLRAKKEWTPNWMMDDLLGAMKIAPEHSFKKMFRQALEALNIRFMQAQREKSVLAIIIDEADFITRKLALLETIRDITDHLEIPVILVGMGKVRANLVKSPQIASRVGQYVEFKPLDFEDCKAVINGLSEVPAADDLVGFVQRHSHGYSREIKEAVVNIEKFGFENDLKTVTRRDMVGQFLMNDRMTGNPIYVTEDD